MNRKARASFRRVFGEETGAAVIFVAAGIFALVGFGALSVDVGYLFAAQRALQASADAAAMAGARDIGVGGTPVATATSYSSVTASPANKNNDPSLTVTWASGYPLLKCFSNIGSTCTTNQTPATSANGIEVRQLATVPLFFGRIFGISSVQISANAVALAAGGVPHPLNVMFIVDTTASMNGTPITNALAGFRTLLGQLWPCPSNLPSCGSVTNGNVATPVDEAGLLVFPPLDGPPASPAPPATDPSQAPYEYDCSTNPQVNIAPAYAGRSGVTSALTASGNSTLHFTATPTFNIGTTALVTEMGTPTSAKTSSGSKVLTFPSGVTAAIVVGEPIQDTTNSGVIPAGTTVSSTTATTVTMSQAAVGSGVANGDLITFGSIQPGTYVTSVTATTAVMSAGATNAVPKGDTVIVKPLYEIVPLSSDYRTSDASGLNTASNLVKAARGGAAGCTQGLDDVGGLGTYYADAITAAQTALTANARPGTTNVIVLLSDGDATATSAGTNNECHLAITAAQNAAKAGTWVYSIAFNSPTSGCSTDSPGITACSTMSQIANMPGSTPGTYFNDQTKFYSDNASGCTSTKNPSITAINSIFQSIGNSLSTSRLLPNNCFGNSPPAWCS